MPAKKTFEKSMSELEETVRALEEGEVSLDESIALFERGIKLTKTCQDMLDKAEQKVSVLLRQADGESAEEEFHIEEGQTE